MKTVFCYAINMQKLIDWLVDYTHLVKGHGLMFLYHKVPAHYLGHVVKEKVPVIILPGIFGRWAFLKPLADHISLLGHPVYIVPKLGNNLHDIKRSSAMVRDMIEEQKIKKVIIVAHSKGGLIGKYLLAHDNKDNAVTGEIAVATPFSGSDLAKLVPHYSYKELAADSKMIQYLKTHTSVNKKIISIIPQYDNHVWHEDGSFLESALENIYVKDRGHHKLLSSKPVWEVILKSLDKISRLK